MRSIPSDGPRASSISLSTWASLSLLFGTALYAVRAGVVLIDDRFETEALTDLARWHVGLTLERAYPFALAVGGLASAAALLLVVRPGFSVLLCSVLFLVALSGWPIDTAYHVVGPVAAVGPNTLFGLAPAAIALAFALVLVSTLARRPRAARAPFSRPSFLWLSVLFAAAVPATGWALFRRAPPSRPVREIVREILNGPPSWTVVSSPPGKLPHVATMTPSVDWHVDGGDLPALVMPPPCEVRFEVRLEDGPVRLRASAGSHRFMPFQLADAPQDCAVLFEIDVNGAVRFTARVDAHAQGQERAWHHAGGPEGLPVEPGDVVTLRTSITHPDVPVRGQLDLLVGFGRLWLERTEERPRERATPAQPNVVLIVMDTLRADSLSCYGAPSDSTPELDALARRGVLYENACATSSWTWPSTASILTGLSPEAHGVVDDGRCYLDARLDTLPEALERRNYTTAAWACNPLLDPNKNFEQGFETYEYYRDFRKTDLVLPELATWMGQHADARFFLYLHLIDPHDPLMPRPEDLARIGASRPEDCPERFMVQYRPALMRGEGFTPEGIWKLDEAVPPAHQRWIRDSYAATVRTTDHYVGEVLAMLAAHGLEESTLVAFTSDHGEELLDHGLLGHDQSLYRELVHVPLILAGPGVPSGVRVATPVSNQHLAWTLARRGGDPFPQARDGIDLTSPQEVRAQTLYFSTEHGWWNGHHRLPILGIQEGSWVLHDAPRGLPFGAPKDTDPAGGQVRLYDLATDPQERIDRSGDESARAAAMRKKLIDRTKSEVSKQPLLMIDTGDETRAMLRRIGYTGDEDEEEEDHR